MQNVSELVYLESSQCQDYITGHLVLKDYVMLKSKIM